MWSFGEGPDAEARKRRLAAIGGTVVFLGLGLLLAPGLARQEPEASADPVAPPTQPQHASRVSPSGEAEAAPEARSEPSRPSASAIASGQGFDCMIGPNKRIDIGSAITGLIAEIPVERSDYVEAGQVLAELESSVETAAVRVAQARADRRVDLASTQARRDLGERRRKRANELFVNDTLSLDLREEMETQATLSALELEQAREDRRVAELELQHSSASLARRTITSPVSGFVIERLMEPGEVVDEETILRIAQVDPLRVEVILPSNWFGRVQPGNRARIVPEAPLDQPRVAEVAIVDRIIDGASGTFGVRLLLPNPDHDLPAGLRCRVEFLGDS